MRKRKKMSKKIIRRSKRKTKEKHVRRFFSITTCSTQPQHQTKVENEKGRQEKGRKKKNNNN